MTLVFLNITQDSDDDSQSSTNSSMQSWIGWFCSLSGHEFYVQVPEDFIEDEFNLTGLSTIIPYYVHALATILDMESGEFFDQQDEEEEAKKPSDQEEDGFWKDDKVHHTKQGRVDPRVVEPYAIMLYGLIHQRYLVTRNGLRLMAERYANGQFGVCPRYLCDLCPVLPVGQSDQIGYDSVYLYCPKCLDIYTPPSSIYSCVDGI